MKESEWLSVCAEFDGLGESTVRACMARGDWKQLPVKYGCAIEWCRLKEEERANASSSKRDAREEETLSIARRALSIAEDANSIATRDLSAAVLQARWAKWAAIVATIAAIGANKDALLALI